VDKIIVKILFILFLPQSMLKTSSFSTYACGKKAVAALRKNLVFHINFPYCCYYCLKYKKYILFFIILQK